MNAFDTGERFYVDLDRNRIEWMRYDPDVPSGGQYVTNTFSLELLQKACSANESWEPEELYAYIEANCRKTVSVAGTKEFASDAVKFATPSVATGLSHITACHLQDLFQAKRLIDHYCLAVLGTRSSYSDLSEVFLGSAITGDKPHEIRVCADLINHRINTFIDGQRVAYRDYESLPSMCKNALEKLNSDELLRVPDVAWAVLSVNEHVFSSNRKAERNDAR